MPGSIELISYKTATLVSGNRYELTSLRRGVYGTPISRTPRGRSSSGSTRRSRSSLRAAGCRQDGALQVRELQCVAAAHTSPPPTSDEYTYDITGRFHNFLKFVANDCTVDSIGTGGPPFTAATVRAYGKVAGVATVGGHQLQEGRRHHADPRGDSEAGKALATTYWALLNPVSWTIYLLTNYSDVLVRHGLRTHLLGDTTTTPDCWCRRFPRAAVAAASAAAAAAGSRRPGRCSKKVSLTENRSVLL
jgi:hypothetical protein